MENVAYNEKLTLFLDYYVQQLMENQNVPIEMWNTNKYQRWANSEVEGWNSILNSTGRKRRTKVFLKIHKLKEDAELVSWQLKSKGLGQPGQKTKKRHM